MSVNLDDYLNQGFHFSFSPPGEISENGVFVAFCGAYMYLGDTPLELLEEMQTNWENDKNLA